MSSPVRNSPVKIEQMRTALMTSPQRYDDLATLTGLSKPAVTLWLKAVKAIRSVHIADWVTDCRGRLFVARFAWGDKPDAKRPGPQRTAADRMRDMRKRRAAAKSVRNTVG